MPRSLAGSFPEELERQSKLKIILTSPQVLEAELRSANSLLLETALAMGAKRIFIDGIGLLWPASSNGNRLLMSGPGSYRELLQQLLEGLQRNCLTAMLSHEIGSLDESRSTLESAGFLADTVIELSYDRRNRLGQRNVWRSSRAGARITCPASTLCELPPVPDYRYIAAFKPPSTAIWISRRLRPSAPSSGFRLWTI